MGGNPGKLAGEDADRLAPGRKLPSHQLFHCAGIGHVVGQGREVIQPIRVGNKLVVMHVLGNFLVTPVKEADIRIGLGNYFAVELQNEAEHSVGGRVRWSHIEHHFLPKKVLSARLIVCGSLRRCGGRIGNLVNRCRRGLAH